MKTFFGLLLFFLSSVAMAQSTAYSCIKDGKPIISAQPCDPLEMEEEERKYQCANLERVKADTVAQQQQRNTPGLNERLRLINRAIFQHRCGRL